MSAPAVLNNAINAALGVAIRGRGAGAGTGDKRNDDAEMAIDQRAGPSRAGGRVRRGGSSSKPYNANRRNGHKTKDESSPQGSKRDGAATQEGAAGKRPAKGDKVDTISMLRNFVAGRYDAGSRLLNLENLENDAAFRKGGPMSSPFGRTAPRAMAGSMWKICATDFPDIQSICLDNNKLRMLAPIAPAELVTFLPNLRNLSLKGNSITSVTQLDVLADRIGDPPSGRRGLRDLNEIILVDNPVQTSAAKSPAGHAAYKEAVLRCFPTLTQLDGMVVAPLMEPGLQAAPRTAPCSKDNRIVFPVDVQPGFADTDETRALTSQFLLKFFTAFDGDRASLAHAFAPEATFSLAVLPNRADRAKAKKLTMAISSKANSAETTSVWQSKSRNVHRHKRADLAARLHCGPQTIAAAYVELPATRHPLDAPTKFVVDSWSTGDLGGGQGFIVVNVHGELAEVTTDATRSFDRTFTLSPALPGSAAANAGWPCQVVADQLIVRPFGGSDAWQPGWLRVGAPAPAAAPAPAIAPASAPMTTSPSNEAMVVELRRQTRLNDTFARQCLAESAWNFDAAMQNFARVREHIPSTAFE